jgi:peptidoglycan/xylan/chitin deacetylase (PgdA/CDA1 family)
MRHKTGLRVVALAAGLAAAVFAGLPGAAGAAVQRGGIPAAAASGLRAHSAQARPPRTVVTFAWGGGYRDQTRSLPIFRRYGMHATYFVPSGLVCLQSRAACARSSPFLTLSQLREVAAGGNEIGGLGVLHVPLTTMPAAEAQREVCDDRVNLFRWGFRPTDFVYPFALENPAVEAIARQCGYNSGLGAGELRGAGKCLSCAWAETIPPRHPMVVRAPVEVNSVGTRWTLGTYQSLVRGAQRHGGGWIILTIHQVCKQACLEGITAGQLSGVLRWLHSQAGRGVAVETMRQVIGGPFRRPVAGPAPRKMAAPGVANAALARNAGNGTGYPACFQASDYGHNTTAFSYQPDGGPGGAGTETVRVSNWASGDAKLLQALDLGACAPSAAAGRRYTVAAQYKATLPTQFDVYYRTAIGSWQYWATSPAFPASATWAKASWSTPAVPAGATAVSFGLAADSDGTISTTGYSVTPVRSYRMAIMLGLAVFVLLCAGLITRGYMRYNRYVRAQAAGAVPAGAAPAAPAGAAGSGPGQPPSAADRAGSTEEIPAPGGRPGA